MQVEFGIPLEYFGVRLVGRQSAAELDVQIHGGSEMSMDVSRVGVRKNKKEMNRSTCQSWGVEVRYRHASEWQLGGSQA